MGGRRRERGQRARFRVFQTRLGGGPHIHSIPFSSVQSSSVQFSEEGYSSTNTRDKFVLAAFGLVHTYQVHPFSEEEDEVGVKLWFTHIKYIRSGQKEMRRCNESF